MNWKEIEKKYPKALALMYEWADKEAIGAFIDDFKYQRMLLDFFDEQGVYVTTSIIYDWYDEKGNPSDTTLFGFFCDIDSKKKHEKSQVCETRKEAEEQAWNKAFEIREGQL